MSPSGGLRPFGLRIPGVLSGRRRTQALGAKALWIAGDFSLSGEGRGWGRARMESFKLQWGGKRFL